MNQFEKKLREVTLPVRPWCLKCSDFQDMLTHAGRYGTTTDGVAALALRQCILPPIEHPTHQPDGSELEYWETQEPTCNLGESKKIADAQLYIREHGYNVALFANKRRPE